ncbi:unnamed protein product [Paramecium octaurelia]|uniref:Uncharacterized protein n=1 Tax=Paramecium octaurelia TaxID=43137 RepID=A0A8S1YKP9_PAROT|nr:unnamed protein product [Paramecium octaurelia]
MIEQQDTNKKGYKYFHQAKVKVKVQNDARYFDKIIPLNENQAFIYFDGGEYHLYDMASEQVVGQGQIIHDVKCFYQIYPQTLCFLDPEDMKVKLLDLQTHQVNEQFVFAASNIVSQNSDKQIKEKLAYKFCIMMINRKQNNVQYLITQDLEKYYSNNTVCHFAIRILPLNYTHETQFDLNPVFEYHYPIQLIMKNCIIGRLTKKRQLFMDKTLKLDRQKSYQLNHIQSKMHSKLFILRQTYLSHQQTLLTGYINIQLLYGSIIMMVFRSQPFLQLIQDLIIMVKNGYLNQNVFQLK